MNELVVQNYLMHYNTPGSHWYQQGPGKRFQAHAKYAMGKANPDAINSRSAGKVLSAFGGKRTSKIKEAFEKSINEVRENRRIEYEKHLAKEALMREKAAQAKIAKENRVHAAKSVGNFLKTGKMLPKPDSSPDLTSKTHSGNTLGMTTDELRAATARLKAENDYLREFENRSKLEKTYRELTASPGQKKIKAVLKKAKEIGKSDVGKIATNLAMTAAYNEISKNYGKDNADKIFAGTRISNTGGKKDGGGNGDGNGNGNGGGNRNKKSNRRK